MNGMIVFFILLGISIIVLIVYLKSKTNIQSEQIIETEEKERNKKITSADQYVLNIIIGWIILLGIFFWLSNMYWAAK